MKARYMIGLRLQQAKEFKAKDDYAGRLYCVTSALVWRETRNETKPKKRK